MKIPDLANSWWLWKWFLAIGVTRKLSYPNLENGVVWDDDQRDLLYVDLDLDLELWSRGSPLPWSGFGMIIKVISSTMIIWNWNNDQGGLLYVDNLELKWWSRGSPLPQSGFGTMIKGISSTLIIWNWNDDQGDLLYLDLALEWWSKGSPLLW